MEKEGLRVLLYEFYHNYWQYICVSVGFAWVIWHEKIGTKGTSACNLKLSEKIRSNWGHINAFLHVCECETGVELVGEAITELNGNVVDCVG